MKKILFILLLFSVNGYCQTDYFYCTQHVFLEQSREYIIKEHSLCIFSNHPNALGVDCGNHSLVYLFDEYGLCDAVNCDIPKEYVNDYVAFLHELGYRYDTSYPTEKMGDATVYSQGRYSYIFYSKDMFLNEYSGNICLYITIKK